jgi:hypothetical protein
MMEVIHSSEMSVLARATWRRIPEDSIFQENYRSASLLQLPRLFYIVSVLFSEAFSVLNILPVVSHMLEGSSGLHFHPAIYTG